MILGFLKYSHDFCFIVLLNHNPNFFVHLQKALLKQLTMNKFFTLLLITVGLGVYSQVELHKNGVLIGTTEAIDSASVSIDHFQSDLYIVNNTGASVEITFTRYRNHHTNGWTDQICDDLLCFNAADVTEWDRPGSPTLVVPAGDSSIMQLKVYPEGINGCAIYTYYVIDDVAKVTVDSIQVTYTINGQACFLGVEEELADIEYSVYPNPASDVLNINVSNSGSNDVLKIYNILGEEVKNVQLKDGKNAVNVADLNNGVYFYSVIRNSQVIESKKLVIKH